MQITIVTHYLDEQGQDFFPNWLEEVKAELTNWQGFVNLQRLIHHVDECCLLLQFESADSLKNWSSSHQHNALLEQLEPYQIKPFQSVGYIAENI